MADLFRTRRSHSFECKHVFKVQSKHSPLQMFLFDITWNSHNLKSITLGLGVQVFIWTFASWYFISFFTNFFHKKRIKKKFSMEILFYQIQSHWKHIPIHESCLIEASHSQPSIIMWNLLESRLKLTLCASQCLPAFYFHKFRWKNVRKKKRFRIPLWRSTLTFVNGLEHRWKNKVEELSYN